MKLYHFTSIYHLATIMEDGFIKTTESNADFLIDHAETDVVWLTSNKNPQSEISLEGSIVDKKQVRLTVNINAIQYLQWAKKNNVDDFTIHMLDSTGGGQARKWFVVERPVLQSEWVMVELFDSQSQKWVEYSDSLHLKLFGKLKLIKTQDGTMTPSDMNSTLFITMITPLVSKRDWNIETEITEVA